MTRRLGFVLFMLSACGGESIQRDNERAEAPGSGGNKPDGETGGATGGTGVGATGANGGTGGSGIGGALMSSGGTGGVGTGGVGSGGVGAQGGGTPGSAGMVSACTNSIIATEAQNYAFASYLELPMVSVKPGVDLTFEWGGVTEDFLGHPMNSMTDVDMVELTLWNLGPDELRAEIHDDSLRSQDLSIIANLETAQQMTSTTLFALTSVGVPLTPEQILPYVDAVAYPPENHTYTFFLASGTMLGQGTRLMQAFKLDPASENTTVTVTNASMGLNWKADLGQIVSPRVPAGTSAITIDWSSMTLTAMGGEFWPTDITEVRVGAFEETPEELDASFLDIELLAENSWRGEVPAGTTFSLSTLKDVGDASFPGIDDEHTWVLALICGPCANPAPWYLTILEPCSP